MADSDEMTATAAAEADDFIRSLYAECDAAMPEDERAPWEDVDPENREVFATIVKVDEAALDDVARVMEGLLARIKELMDGITEIRDGTRTAREVYDDLVAIPGEPT